MTQETALPSPAERPAADVVIYDGNCSICSAQIRKLVWWDSRQQLAYLSLHDSEVQQRWPDMSHDRLMEEMCLVDAQGKQHWGPEAIRYLTCHLRRLWWATPLTMFPGSMLLWRPLYRWVAANRYRLSAAQACDNEACRVHR